MMPTQTLGRQTLDMTNPRQLALNTTNPRHKTQQILDILNATYVLYFFKVLWKILHRQTVDMTKPRQTNTRHNKP